MLPVYIYPRLFLRTPLLSYEDYAAGSINKPLGNAPFRAALYLASPTLYRLLEAKNFDPATFTEKELLSLEKYYNRMSFRPTPFGMFSAFTMTGWGDHGPIVLSEAGEALIHLLPDQELAARAGSLLTGNPLAGSYRLNPTLYRLGREFRFIKTVSQADGPGLLFSLESLDVNPLTRQLCGLLQREVKTGPEIIAFLITKTNCSRQDALSYLEFLKDAGVIFSTLDPNITGEDYLGRIDRELAGKFDALPEKDAATAHLRALEEELKDLLTQRGVPEPARYFYVNTERKACAGSLPVTSREKIAAATRALQKLCAPPELPLLTRFRNDFKSRFDDAKIPLLQAMDPDAGIGYGDLAEQHTDAKLLKYLKFPNGKVETGQLNWSAVHRLLLEKWNRLGSNKVIGLRREDLEALEMPDGYHCPPSLAVMFRLTAEGILVENAGGVTATALTGRFTALSDEVWQLGREIAALEKEANPGIVFAEIAQLSHLHTDNVNRRRHVYDYEIPINCVSILPDHNQLPLCDLVVSVRGGEVLLESARLKKRVVPRLSSAYNFKHNSLAVFRFLCDLQYQSLHAGLSFDLEHYFPGMASYPRVAYEGTILSPAKWHLKTDVFKPSLHDLREQRGLPARIALTHFDQQLVFNLDDREQAGLFKQCIQGMPEFTLQEFLVPPDGAVQTKAGRPLINQFISFVINPDPVYPPALPILAPAKKVQKDFITGSTWLYLKIYCTPHTANELLTRQILPVVRELLKIKPANWFFIRYTDPGYHIRLRIRVSEGRIGSVISLLKNRFEGLVSDHIVREYQADTYRRELGRYGGDLIGTVESFFGASSDLVLRFIKNNANGRYSVDQLAISTFALLLDALIPGLPEQLQFLERISNSFYSEFNGDKSFRIELDKSYRSLKEDFSLLIRETGFYKTLKISKALRVFKLSLETLADKARGFDHQRKTALLADLIHMHLNRVYNDRQRQQEMMLYYCFYKYKLSRTAILKRASAFTPALDN